MTEKKRKDKEIVLELEAQTKEVRHQLSEQLRGLDQRLDSHHCMTWELHEFYQHRAEIEQEYSRSLERLVKQTRLRHKSEKQKRETWSEYSVFKMWQNILDSTVSMSKNHSVLSEAYSSLSIKGFAQIMDDLQRIYSKCREIATTLHKEVAKVLDELQNSMKTYHLYHGQSLQSANKLERAETQKSRVEQDAKKSSTLSKRFLSYEKQTEKQKAKLETSNQKVMRARNDYLLSIETANGCIHKYFMGDLPELMDVMDYGYHLSMRQVMNVNVELERSICRRQLGMLDKIKQDAVNLNQGLDRHAFIQTSHQTFSLPKKFKFQQHKGDSVSEIVAQRPVRTELNERFKVILERIRELKLQNEELWKTLETADSSMLEKRTLKDFEPDSLFSEDRTLGKSLYDLDKIRAEQIETLMFYISKYKEWLINSNKIARLQARSKAIEKALVNSNIHVTRPMPVSLKVTKKKQLGKGTQEGRPKLFGGSIEEYVQATCQEIPVIIRCCVNFINLHGMHQQGLFRVPGSVHEINEFKQIFERGDEVVLKKVEARNLNSIAGVLKLYFRELREPLFPLQLFHELISCIASDVNDLDSESLQKSIVRLQELLLPLQRATVLVMRYLFAFLNHVTEHSDENLMDARNLAICFGPTLLPLPPERANYQGKVNDLIQLLIFHHDKIFPNDGGVIYEKCMAESCEFEETLDCALENVADAKGEESDEELQGLDAVALYDFESRTGQELSFKKGDLLVLKRRISEDWWEGLHGDQLGLVPTKYVATNVKRSGERMRTSSESLPNKPSEITTSRPPATECLDRSKSESDICEELASSSAAVGQSGSSTTSDLSRGDGSLATWSGKSSSSKEILDEAVLLTDSEAASPVECHVSVDLKRCDSRLSSDKTKENPRETLDQGLVLSDNCESSDDTLRHVAISDAHEESSDLTLRRKRNSLEYSCDETCLGSTSTNPNCEDSGFFTQELRPETHKTSLSETSCSTSNIDFDKGTLAGSQNPSSFSCTSLRYSEPVPSNDLMEDQAVPVVQTVQPVDPFDHDVLFLKSMADFDKTVSSFGEKTAERLMNDVIRSVSSLSVTESEFACCLPIIGPSTSDAIAKLEPENVSEEETKISYVTSGEGHVAAVVEQQQLASQFLCEKFGSSHSSLLPSFSHPSPHVLPAAVTPDDPLPPPPEFLGSEDLEVSSADGLCRCEMGIEILPLKAECEIGLSLEETYVPPEEKAASREPFGELCDEDSFATQDLSDPWLEDSSLTQDHEMLSGSKAKPRPPPIMKKPPKPNAS